MTARLATPRRAGIFGIWAGAFLLFAILAAAAPARAEGSGTNAHDEHAPVAPALAHIHDRQVFSVKVGRNGHSAEARAQHANEVLEHAVEDTSDVHVTQEGDVAIVYVGISPLIQIGPEDATADGDASVAVHAAEIAAHVTDALRAERRRSALAKSVFSVSLLVFSALMVFLALGKLGGVVTRIRQWVESRPSTIPAVRIAGIDVLRPTALRGITLGTIDGSRWLLRIGLIYLWLLFALSLFDVTRAYSERLTGFVLAPLSGFVSRLTATMPVLLLGAVAAVVLLLTMRVITLFFEGVTRGEPPLSWLRPDLAAPTSLLVRIGLVLLAACVATPLLTGNDEGPLARISVVAIGALALALVPILASGIVGVTVLFGREIKLGDFVELGERAGVVRNISLLSITIEDAQGCAVHVPHLRSLLRPTRVKGPVPAVVVEVRVSPSADIEEVKLLLSRVADQVGIPHARVELVRVELARLDADAAVYLVTVRSESVTVRSDVLATAAKAMREAGMALGRAASEGPAR